MFSGKTKYSGNFDLKYKLQNKPDASLVLIESSMKELQCHASKET